MLTTDRVAGGALALIALVVFWESRKLPLGSLRNPGPQEIKTTAGRTWLAGVHQ